jgi:hypothetical protein
MKTFKVQCSGESFFVEARDIFTASKTAIDLYHEKRKRDGMKTRIPARIDLAIYQYYNDPYFDKDNES